MSDAGSWSGGYPCDNGEDRVRDGEWQWISEGAEMGNCFAILPTGLLPFAITLYI